MNLLPHLATEVTALLLPLQQGPEPEDVKAGWTGFAVFLLLALAVVVLGFSLSKQLRKTREARDRGVYGGDAATGTDGTDRDHDRGSDGDAGGSGSGDSDSGGSDSGGSDSGGSGGGSDSGGGGGD